MSDDEGPVTRRPRRKWVAICGVLFAVVFVLFVLAIVGLISDQSPWNRCLNTNFAKLDDTVENCTAVIQAGKVTPRDLGRLFNARGYAYSFQEKKNDAALRDFDEAIRLDDTVGIYFRNRGRVHESARDWDRAIDDFDTAIRLDPNESAYTNRARVYAAKGEVDRAIDDYNEAVRLAPDNASLLLRRAVTYADKGDLERAVGDARAAFQAAKSDRMFGITLTYQWPAPSFQISADRQELTFTGTFQVGVAKDFRNILETTPTIRRVRLESGGGLLLEARRFVREIKARNLDTYVARHCASACTDAFLAGRERLIAPAGRLGFHQGRDNETGRADQSIDAIRLVGLRKHGLSEAFARRANSTPPNDMWYPPLSELVAEHVVTRITRDGEFPQVDVSTQDGRTPDSVFLSRGLDAVEKTEYERAVRNFDVALRLNPENTSALLGRADVHATRKEFSDAIADYNQVLSRDPRSEHALQGRGQALGRSGDVDAAIRDFNEVIRLDPEYVGFFFVRGVAYGRKGNYPRAIQDFDHVLAEVPDFGAALRERASSYESLGDHQREIADLNRAIELVPDDAVALNNRCWRRAIDGALDAALADCNTSLQLQPAKAATLDSRGFVYLKMLENEKAIADYSAALALDPKLAVSLYGRGLAKLRTDDRAGGCADILAGTVLMPDIVQKEKEYGLTFDPPDCPSGNPAQAPP